MSHTPHAPKTPKKVKLTAGEVRQVKDINALADADELEIEIPAPVVDQPSFRRQETQSDERHEPPADAEGVCARVTRWLRQW